MKVRPVKMELLKRSIHQAEFGLEKESLRITCDGFLSGTKHPFGNEPNITRDFCENQVELITDVFHHAENLIGNLECLQRKVLRKLEHLETGRELLWPFSNPPYVRGEADISIAQFDGKQKEKTKYRNYLAKKYGKRKMLFSGIHLNYSFTDEMLREWYQTERIQGQQGLEDCFISYQEYKNRLYLELVQKAVRYSWFLVYLMAASPVADESFYGNLSGKELPGYASIRCGKDGYWNTFIPVFEYKNLETYIRSIETYIQAKQLSSISELYYPFRLKSKGETSIQSLRTCGINHIELRMLDVNPLSPVGIFKEDVEFLHYFLFYLLSKENKILTGQEQIDLVQNEQEAAKFDDGDIFIRQDGTKRQIRGLALEVLQDMEKFYQMLAEDEPLEAIRYQKGKLLTQNNRYADRIYREFGNDYVQKGICLADRYAKELLAKER